MIPNNMTLATTPDVSVGPPENISLSTSQKALAEKSSLESIDSDLLALLDKRVKARGVSVSMASTLKKDIKVGKSALPKLKSYVMHL